MLDFDIITRSRARVGLIFALSVVICWIPRFGFGSEILEQKFDGIVVPRLSVQVTPQIQGVINQVLFEPGQRVSKGDPLFEIEPGDFAVNVRIAQADLAESHARLSIAEDAAGRQRVLVAENSTPQQIARRSEIDAKLRAQSMPAMKPRLPKPSWHCRERTSWQASRELWGVHM